MQSITLPLRVKPVARVVEHCIVRKQARSLIAESFKRSFRFSSQSRQIQGSGGAGEPFNAAPEIDFEESLGGKEEASEAKETPVYRIVPASPSYFSTRPRFVDGLLDLEALLQKHQALPVVPSTETRRVKWADVAAYERMVGEKVRPSRYKRLLNILARLNLIHPDIMPEEVKMVINSYGSYIDEISTTPRVPTLDEQGRARAIGRRKTSHALVYLVEGDGQILVNGKTLNNVFGRIHHRESAIWPLKATNRLDKYNVFALASGGGLTGQAEAITLGIAKALLVHEPLLKPALRKAGVVSRDPRKVERKKPGKLKARKMPAWVKR